MQKQFRRAYTLGQVSSYVALRQVVILKTLGGVSQYVDDSLPKDANHASLYEIVKGGTIHNIRLDEATRHDQDVQVGASVGVGGTSVSTMDDCKQFNRPLQFEGKPFVH